MTRVCLGYEGHECEVSLEGAYVRRMRCRKCARRNSQAVEKLKFETDPVYRAKRKKQHAKAMQRRRDKAAEKKAKAFRLAEQRASEPPRQVVAFIRATPMTPASRVARRQAEVAERYGQIKKSADLINYAKLLESGKLQQIGA